MDEKIRPSKKQQDLLKFITAFIGEHGYSPSYREIMAGCNYTSVATVSLHVNSLIKRGHLRKRDRSARSLEVIGATEAKPLSTNIVKPGEEKWLVEKVEHLFRDIEQQAQPDEVALQNLRIVVASLQVLGLEGAAQSFNARLHMLSEPVDN